MNMKKSILTMGALATLVMTGFASHEAQANTAAHGGSHEKHWDYSENGPAHWSEFSKTCGTGHSQSPINIIPGKTVAMNHQYELSMHEDINTTASVIDNGHSIKVTPKTGGTIKLNGEEFKLLQFHFHGKSEHTVDGKRYDMVAHMVHQNTKTRQLAVVAVFFKEGAEDPFLNNVINNVGGEIKVNPQDLLPEDTSHYFHYVGSLTTPPCSENVQWYLLKEPVEAFKKQIKAFREYYVDNERPVQALYERHVESN